MRKRVEDLDAMPRPRADHVLNPLVALLAHHKDADVASFRDVFEDVACDWRLVRVAEGAAAARHVMTRGLPELLVICSDLPGVNGSDFVEWMRSFRSGYPIPVLVYGEVPDMESREQFLRNNVHAILPTPCPRTTLASHLGQLIDGIEKRRFPSMS